MIAAVIPLQTTDHKTPAADTSAAATMTTSTTTTTAVENVLVTFAIQMMMATVMLVVVVVGCPSTLCHYPALSNCGSNSVSEISVAELVGSVGNLKIALPINTPPLQNLWNILQNQTLQRYSKTPNIVALIIRMGPNYTTLIIIKEPPKWYW